jgi:molecular chaperone GrpE
VKECESLLNQRDKELSELHDRLLRNQAEFENYKKRMAREKAGMLKFGNESLMRELLPVIDNLDLFLAHASTARTIKGMAEGIEIVRKELVRKLETFGLKSITAQGEKFDPDKHEAVSQVETSEYPEDTVVSELQRGYAIHERLLRPAKVIVAKTPAPHSPEAEL